MAGPWWENDPRERYWLEATDREDIGADLRAPDVDASGRENWRYSLFRAARPGEVVFHYDGRRTNSIVGRSVVAGPAKPQPIVWKARGSYARERGATPVEQPGYVIPLADFTLLEHPLTLEQLRAAKPLLQELTRAEEISGKRPLYFPFELSKRPVRLLQGYAFKLPAAFVAAFPQLGGGLSSPVTSIASEATITTGSARRNPPWSRDELILALDLYMTNPASPPTHESAEVAALSETLNRLGTLLGSGINDRFRNANGIYMKMMNFRRFDPAFTSAGMTGLTRGNKDEAAVWAEFASDRARLSALAALIQAAIDGSDAELLAAGDANDIEEAEEGRLLTRVHRVRERSRELVEVRKARALAVTGGLACEVCGFDFQARYGERGQGFIEAHHTRAIHTLKPGEKTRLDDLALLCANCHRMIHARRPWLTLHELRATLSALDEIGDLKLVRAEP